MKAILGVLIVPSTEEIFIQRKGNSSKIDLINFWFFIFVIKRKKKKKKKTSPGN